MQKLATVATLCLLLAVAILGKLVWNLQQHNRILESRILALEHHDTREDMMLAGFWARLRQLEKEIRILKTTSFRLMVDFGRLWSMVWDEGEYGPFLPLPEMPERNRLDQETNRFRLLQDYLVV